MCQNRDLPASQAGVASGHLQRFHKFCRSNHLCDEGENWGISEIDSDLYWDGGQELLRVGSGLSSPWRWVKTSDKALDTAVLPAKSVNPV